MFHYSVNERLLFEAIPVDQVSSVGDGKDAVFPLKGLDLVVLTALDMDVGTNAFVLKKLGVFFLCYLLSITRAFFLSALRGQSTPVGSR